jgi:hypothetical protein
VELNTKHVDLPVPNPHDQAILGPGVDEETRRKIISADNQRMISRSFERYLQTGKDTILFMVDPGGFSMP